MGALRKGVANEIYKGFIEDRVVCRKRVRDIVASEGMTLVAYMARTEHELWASIMEITYAAEIKNIKVDANMGGGEIYRIGNQGAKKTWKTICLVDGHYIVKKTTRRRREIG